MSQRAELINLSEEELIRRQRLLQLLTESRFDSMQRRVSFGVMVHAMGKMVQAFWPIASFGLLGYDMSRSQSSMRVATTASPVSGTEVRDITMDIAVQTRHARAASTVQRIWRSQRLVRWVKRSISQRNLATDGTTKA